MTNIEKLQKELAEECKQATRESDKRLTPVNMRRNRHVLDTERQMRERCHEAGVLYIQ